MAMTEKTALTIVIDYAGRWGENFEEQFPRRLDASMTDEQVKEIVTDHGSQKIDDWELDEALGLRDLWKAMELIQGMIKDRTEA